MDEVRVYIANLGKYADGEVVGAWFVLPLHEEVVAEKLGLNAQYREYAVHDYKAPFDIPECASVNEINALYDSYRRSVHEK